MNSNITSADASAIMTVEKLFPNGFKLQQFSTDAAISQGDDTLAETRIGVDGHMVAGYTPSILTLTITLEPTSPSISYLDTLYQATKNNRRTYDVTVTISIPSLKKVLTYSNGVLKTGRILPDLQKVLAPVPYTFDFGSVKKM